MSILNLFKKKDYDDELAESLSSIIVQISDYESDTISSMWKVEIDDSKQVLFALEYSIMLLAIADRLAFEKFGDPYREKIMNLTVDKVKQAFCRQTHFGKDDNEKGDYFENKFNEGFHNYSECSSILGKDRNQIVWTGVLKIIDEFLTKTGIKVTVEIVLETGKEISNSVVAMFTTEPFKKISSSEHS